MTSTHANSPSTAPLARQSAPPTERWPSRWAWAPAALLVTLIGTQVSVLAAVLDDPTFSTEPDYYRKAVDWDAHMARTRESQALGWSTRARVEPAEPGASRTPWLTLWVSDRYGKPVSGAHLQALAFFNARAARPLTLSPTEVAPGEYRAGLNADHAGVWELRLAAQRGAEHYETSLRIELTREAR
jgi:nitrogen fixation protein FixH